MLKQRHGLVRGEARIPVRAVLVGEQVDQVVIERDAGFGGEEDDRAAGRRSLIIVEPENSRRLPRWRGEINLEGAGGVIGEVTCTIWRRLLE
jgi:hypothetical protein